ncbi:cytochrome C [Neisseria musculi]|uniref:Lipoprotein n=1 Tax=Neisseria musculi TaxID=1815583 RepID=A0A7H1M863_9NEIS|nr:cytochrome C [Neisseria musculi]QNT57828.1 hypothetical protein H7A79_1723 [Neisseria musculi]
MKPYAFALAAAALLGLCACGQKAETSVPADSAQVSAASDADAVQTLTGSDGKISIVIQGSHFADASGGDLPNGVDTGELTLLQRDESSGITIYVANLGTPKTDAATYFANLKAALHADKSLSQVQTGAATDTRMNYRFTQNSADTQLHENCIAIYETAALYNVCALSNTAGREDLAAVLKEVNLTK